jgi:hypothetical protein
MPFQLSPRGIALILMIAGVLSLLLREHLAKLDSLILKGGPSHIAQTRHRIARRMIMGAGACMVALALALVALH